MPAPGVADSLQAASPQRNASVHASAGTGKTWLLVTRIIRLLMNGASQDSIMAVTFTRKAAAEMQERLGARLRELMSAQSEAALDALLLQCGITPDRENRQQARSLYEQYLFNTYPLRATTFHAFCQELLQRFPLEAGVPPGFEIIESTVLLEQAAWDALFAEATQAPESTLALALELLIELCNGLPNTRHALLSFLSHRSDWWAYTGGQYNAPGYAQRQLASLLDISPGEDPLADFPDERLRALLPEFSELLGRNNTATDLGFQKTLDSALTGALPPDQLYKAVKGVYLTAKGEPRIRKSSASLRKRLGNAGEQRYLELHAQLVSELLEIEDRLARTNTLQASSAWYTAGVQLLEHFQHIKREQRLLDFADLEWQACELLNRSEHASWVQYKLDRRIDHLLVDEFQDTNPTQWRLLLPLLEELAAGAPDRARSVFLVGDEKQSIYRFRRANPALLGAASQWLATHLDAVSYPLDSSRRSAQAVIDCVNRVFGTGTLNTRISNFKQHSTHHGDLFGHVEVLVLQSQAAQSETPPAANGLRDPLQAPRISEEDQRHYREGQCIAERIQALMENHTLIGARASARALAYGDIMILLRQRTHAAAYERALRDAGIPYLGAGRGTLLENLEVLDLEALLNILISPYDNLALAQVLRSPLFDASDDELMQLAARAKGSWYAALADSAAGENPVLASAARMLGEWRALAGQLPVHDLLDRIYHEGDVLSRYEAAWPPALRPRARANLTRFIELALELDSGRYPSLPHFLDQLTRLRRFEQGQPDEGAPEESDSNRVRMMTIHATKGLEAPVVFLADSAAPDKKARAFEALIDWPAQNERPACILLSGKRDAQDSITRELLERQAWEDLREDANLLYVAMTRARQYLFISGSAPAKDNPAHWYGLITAALEPYRQADGENRIVHETSTPPLSTASRPPAAPEVTPDPRLAEKIPFKPLYRQIAPSYSTGPESTDSGDPDGRERGIAIHYLLDRLSRDERAQDDALLSSIAGGLGRDVQDPDLLEWWEEALRVYHDPALAPVFNRGRYEKAYNEVPIQYRSGEHMIYGIIDRLVLRKDSILVVDYKTHRTASADTIPALTETYREQLGFYARGAALLWPERSIEACLLFTACSKLVEVNTAGPAGTIGEVPIL